MSNDPDVIRAQIEATRAGLSSDVNELGDKVSPAQIAKRQTDRLKGTAASVKNHIMGSADDAKSSAGNALSSAGDALSSAQDAVSNAPGRVARQAQGSPVAAGLIAFGAGMLLSSLLPASRPEAQAAAAIKAQAQPLVEQVSSAAKEVAGNLQEPAQNALESVKSTASDAVDTVKEEGASAASDVQGQAQDAVGTVKDESASAAADVKGQAQDAKNTVQQHAG
jgi:gas vesicle protein